MLFFLLNLCIKFGKIVCSSEMVKNACFGLMCEKICWLINIRSINKFILFCKIFIIFFLCCLMYIYIIMLLYVILYSNNKRILDFFRKFEIKRFSDMIYMLWFVKKSDIIPIYIVLQL